jgi:hypothetical protein
MINADGRPQFTTISANWDNFNAVDIPAAASPVQRREMNRAFIAGAGTALMLVVDAYVDGQIEAQIDRLRAELHTWLAVANARRRRR